MAARSRLSSLSRFTVGVDVAVTGAEVLLILDMDGAS